MFRLTDYDWTPITKDMLISNTRDEPVYLLLTLKDLDPNYLVPEIVLDDRSLLIVGDYDTMWYIRVSAEGEITYTRGKLNATHHKRTAEEFEEYLRNAGAPHL